MSIEGGLPALAEALAEVMRWRFGQPDGGQSPRPAPSLP